jgi:SAM-dependent methyltransferase
VELQNTYEDARYAEAYARLEFPGTYLLAFRDLPALLAAEVSGRRALDFGCGAGRSTRFLRGLGFEAAGVDISAAMIREARERDPGGEYLLIPPADLGALAPRAWDLVLSAFTFDNIPTREARLANLLALSGLLAPGGRLVNLVSSPELYLHEWASFSTRGFPENRAARSGDRVRCVITGIGDDRPVDDVLCSEEDYRALYRQAGLEVRAVHRPLGREEDGVAWVSETRIAPWTIYVLGRAGEA